MSAPKFLYRYQKLDEHLGQSLKEGSIFFCRPEKYNDPFDSRLKFDTSSTSEERFSWVRDLFKRSYPDLKITEIEKMVQAALSIQNEATVAAMINEASERIAAVSSCASLAEHYDDILMWAHYANGHRGVCLQFDRTRAPFLKAEPVHYSQEYPSVKFVKVGKEEYGKVLLTKSEHWKYEKEWRLVYVESESCSRVFDPTALTGIIFGCMLSAAEKAQIKEWSKLGPCTPKFYEAILGYRKFTVEVPGFAS